MPADTHLELYKSYKKLLAEIDLLYENELKAISKLSPNHISLVKALTAYRELFNSDLTKLHQHLQGEFWRFFIDGCLQNMVSAQGLPFQSTNVGWLPFEKREPGYLQAMAKAFAYSVTYYKKGNQLSVDFILKLHKKALKVSNTNYQKPDALSKRGEFRRESMVYFRLLQNNTTVSGVRELIQKINRGNPFLNFLVFKGEEFHNFENHTAVMDEKTAVSVFKKYVSGNSQKVVGVGSYVKLDGTQEREQSETVARILKQNLEQLMIDFKKNMNKTENAYNKLSFIIRFIRECEQLHPFKDGNCRTFCMLLLNYLLFSNGFPMTIQEDPNSFDCFSINELVESVIKGMASTLTLAAMRSEEKKLFGISTEKILFYLSKEERVYFRKNEEVVNDCFTFRIPGSERRKDCDAHVLFNSGMRSRGEQSVNYYHMAAE